MNKLKLLIASVMRLLLGVVLAYIVYNSLTDLILGLNLEHMLRHHTVLGAVEVSTLFALVIGLIAIWRPWSSASFLVASFILVAASLVSPVHVSRVSLYLILIGVAILASSVSEKYIIEYQGEALRYYKCRSLCLASTVLSQLGYYGSIIAVSYYFSILVSSLYRYVLQPRGAGLFYSLWSLSSTSLLVQGLFLFTVIVIVYLFSSKIVMPFLYALTAPSHELYRLRREYLENESRKILGQKTWYHTIISQSIGFATAFPAAIIGYSASSLAASLLGLRPNSLDQYVVMAGLTLSLGTLAYYVAKRLMLHFMSRRISWRTVLYTSAGLLAGIAVLSWFLGGVNPLNLFSQQTGENTVAMLDKQAAQIERTVSTTIESSEEILEIAAKMLWG